MLTFLHQHSIEIAGTVLSLIYLYLSIKQRVGLWVFGFLSALLYVVVFYQSQLYAIMSLQFYYMGVSIYGWISWRAGKEETGEEMPVKRISLKYSLVLLIIGIGLFFGYYYTLSEHTDAYAPVIDSFTTAFSIIATWMLARKFIEHWLIWMVIDSISAGLYIHRGLYFTALLFVAYAVMAVVGWVQWRKSILEKAKKH